MGTFEWEMTLLKTKQLNRIRLGSVWFDFFDYVTVFFWDFERLRELKKDFIYKVSTPDDPSDVCVHLFSQDA